MTPWRIIGIGSPHGADRLGWLVIDRLRTHLATHPGAVAQQLELLSLDRPGPALLQQFSDGKHILLVDALLSSEHPNGAIRRFDLQELAQASHSISTHDLGVTSALALASALHELPQGILLGVVVADDAQLPDDKVIERLLQEILQVLQLPQPAIPE